MKDSLLISLLNICVLLSLGVHFSGIAVAAEDGGLQVSVYTTSGDKKLLLAKQEDLLMQREEKNKPLPYSQARIILDDTITYQEIDGFGAAMTESSAYLINQLPSDKRQAVLESLFSEDGIRISFVRLQMGASDFALNSFTYNDLSPGEVDLELAHFSIQRDEEHVIPVLQDAFRINRQIKLMASPWSAPTWMKTSGNLNHGSLRPEYYEVYSRYFIKFIEAYQAHGLPIYAVTLQNEPLHESWSYPSMRMTSRQQLDFIKVIGPAFEERGINTLIITYDHNWDRYDYSFPIYEDEEASQYVAGAGFHCYGGDVSAQSKVHDAFPEKGIWFTECSGGEWATNFGDNLLWNMENLFIGSVNHHSKGVLLWNIALDENHGPKNRGCDNCRGVVTITRDGEVHKNEEYYSIAHFSKFVEPQAVRIASIISGNKNIIGTAFKNPNGDIVVVVANKVRNQQRITLEYKGLTVQHQIPARSVSTLIISSEGHK